MQNIRELAFWMLDKLHGSPIKTKFNLLSQAVRDKDYSRKALSEILQYARETVPFYRGITSNDLAAFPVIEKATMKADYSAFRSSDFPDDDELIKLYTSGSSGTPFMAIQNREKDQYHKAGLILRNREIGWNVGDRWAHMRNWGFGAPAKRSERLKKNMVPLSILDLNDEKKEHIVQTLLKDKKLAIILGYASGLERIADYIVEHHYEACDFGVKLIIADSDNLKSSTWDLLERIFRCPVLNRYANIENGIIAITKPGDRTFYVLSEQVYVEVLKPDCDETAEEGEMGRVVITDLHNRAMPFIRYNTGDLAVAKKIVNGECMEFESLQGREISALRKTDGTLLSETNIMGRFKDFLDISRYQIIQKSEKSYVMILEKAPPSADAKCAAELKKIFGNDAEVRIEHTEYIPCERSGKYKVTISELPAR